MLGSVSLSISNGPFIGARLHRLTAAVKMPTYLFLVKKYSCKDDWQCVLVNLHILLRRADLLKAGPEFRGCLGRIVESQQT